jgi:TctA family transporter
MDSSASEGILALFTSAAFLACCLAAFLIDIVLVIWVYMDASKRGENAILWAIVVFLLGFPIGILIYLLLGRRNPTIPPPPPPPATLY